MRNMKQTPPTCFDCRVALKHQGFCGSFDEPPEPSFCECLDPLASQMQEHWSAAITAAETAMREALKEKMHWQPANNAVYDLVNDKVAEDFARICPFFQPVTADVCACCGEKIDRPAYMWKHWAIGRYDEVAVCGDVCKRLMENIESYQEDSDLQWRLYKRDRMVLFFLNVSEENRITLTDFETKQRALAYELETNKDLTRQDLTRILRFLAENPGTGVLEAISHLSSSDDPLILTARIKEDMAKEADRLGEGSQSYPELIMLSDSDLCSCYLEALKSYAESQGLI